MEDEDEWEVKGQDQICSDHDGCDLLEETAGRAREDVGQEEALQEELAEKRLGYGLLLSLLKIPETPRTMMMTTRLLQSERLEAPP